MGLLKKWKKRLDPKEATRKHLETQLEIFYPSSANFWHYPELTYSAANNFPNQLVNLLGEQSSLVRPPVTSANDFTGSVNFDRLAGLFNENGSDKSMNGYTGVYAKIIEDVSDRKTIDVLEIGLGTNNPDAVSTMGATGSPGASLRAFRDFLPNANIYGADVDSAILFQEERIKTAFVDQTDPLSFDKMTATFGCSSFDFILDDGLHSTEANLNTATFGLRSLKEGGWLVVEDIPERSLVVWELVAGLLPPDRIRCQLIRAKAAYLFAAKRLSL